MFTRAFARVLVATCVNRRSDKSKKKFYCLRSLAINTVRSLFIYLLKTISMNVSLLWPCLSLSLSWFCLSLCFHSFAGECVHVGRFFLPCHFFSILWVCLCLNLNFALVTYKHMKFRLVCTSVRVCLYCLYSFVSVRVFVSTERKTWKMKKGKPWQKKWYEFPHLSIVNMTKEKLWNIFCVAGVLNGYNKP